MKKVDNIDPIERKVQKKFHCLAKKYGIDVDKIAEIIEDWKEWEDRNFIICYKYRQAKGI